MKKIILYFEELFATPMNTPGMGNPSAPEGDLGGSGDVPISATIKPKGKKKRKHLRDYLTH